MSTFVKGMWIRVFELRFLVNILFLFCVIGSHHFSLEVVTTIWYTIPSIFDLNIILLLLIFRYIRSMVMCPLGASTLFKTIPPLHPRPRQRKYPKKKKIISIKYYTSYLPVISDVISVV
jgi:hypothetical protein